MALSHLGQRSVGPQAPHVAAVQCQCAALPAGRRPPAVGTHWWLDSLLCWAVDTFLTLLPLRYLSLHPHGATLSTARPALWDGCRHWDALPYSRGPAPRPSAGASSVALLSCRWETR